MFGNKIVRRVKAAISRLFNGKLIYEERLPFHLLRGDEFQDLLWPADRNTRFMVSLIMMEDLVTRTGYDWRANIVGIIEASPLL
jgi:hypothetical protein